MSQFLIALCCIATCVLPMSRCVAQMPVGDVKKSEKTVGDPKKQLGVLFLKAIQADNMDKYLECWVQFGDVETQLEKLPEGVPRPTAEQLKKMRGYLDDRNELVRISFPILRRALAKKVGNLDELVVSDVITNNVKIKGGQTFASSIDVVLATKDARQIAYHIDDAILRNERWYFSDKPDSILTLRLAKDKTEAISLGEYATEEELEKLAKRGDK